MKLIYATVIMLCCLASDLVVGDIPKRNEWQERAFKEGCHKDQMNINLCSEYDYQVLYARMNELYNKKMENLSEKNKKRLANSQQAWYEFIKADCLYQNGPREESGTIWPQMQNHCLSKFIMQRVDQINTFLECTENGCPQ